MSGESIDEIPTFAGPDLDLLIERSTGEESSVGRKRNVIDCLLMARHSLDGVLALGGVPKVDGEIIRTGNQPFRFLR